MRWLEDGSDVLVRLEAGERVPETLTDFAQRMGIVSGEITGIGAVRNTVLGAYDLVAKRYDTFEVPGVVEVVSLIGNVSIVSGQPSWHLHASVADAEGNLKGGHVVGFEVAVTLECWIHRGAKLVGRTRDDRSGLNLLDL